MGKTVAADTAPALLLVAALVWAYVCLSFYLFLAVILLQLVLVKLFPEYGLELRQLVFPFFYRVWCSKIGYFLHARSIRDRDGMPPHSLIPEASRPAPVTPEDEAVASRRGLWHLQDQGCHILPIACASDNYSYLLVCTRTKQAAVVDACDPAAVKRVLAEHADIRLTHILTTHRHWDHSAGNDELKATYPRLEVIGAAADPPPAATRLVGDGDVVRIGGLQVDVLLTPGHTIGHIMFKCGRALFTGDMLFAAGCGMFFEGDAQTVLQTFNRVREMPGETLLYPGHEYTLPNLLFAREIEPENPALLEMLRWAQHRRSRGLGTVPTSVQQELQYNPFLRAGQASVRRGIVRYCNEEASPDAEYLAEDQVLARLRLKKDSFRPGKAAVEST